MEIFKSLISILLVFLTHTLLYFLGKSNGYSKGSHEGFIRAKRAYDNKIEYLHSKKERKPPTFKEQYELQPPEDKTKVEE